MRIKKSDLASTLHPRNRHRGRYDFQQLTSTCPELTPFVYPGLRGDLTIDFAHPAAVKTLNRALLQHFYRISKWDIPPGYLCPPIPGRADYLHYIADLLGSCRSGIIPRGRLVRVLDIGVGANCIYPMIGRFEYGWSFVGSDRDPVALDSAKRIVEENESLMGAVELRLQTSPPSILKGVLLKDEVFDVSICNPPFHASLEEAQEGSLRKWNQLGIEPGRGKLPQLNFGGQEGELWCPGGEVAFVGRLIRESSDYAQAVFFFSALISKEASLPAVYAALKKQGVVESWTLEMAQGQKKSRVVAWTFLNRKQRSLKKK